MTITRREVMKRGGGAVVVAAAAATIGVSAKAAQPGPLCEGVQALVNEIRQGLEGSVTTASFSALQEVADRLEALPGIQSIPNEIWERYWRPSRARLPYNHGAWALRPPLGRAI